MELLRFLRHIVDGKRIAVRAPFDLADTRVCVMNADGVLVSVREITFDPDSNVLALLP